MLHNAPHIYIYPNTEGNIGVKKCENPSSLRLKKCPILYNIIYIYVYVKIDKYIHIYIYVCIGMASNVFLFLVFFQIIG